MKRLIATITCICLFVVTGCTTVRNLPRDTYGDADLSSGETYFIQTTGGHHYESDTITRTDSSFVVHTRRVTPETRYSPRFVPIDPVEVRFADVESFGTMGVSTPRTLILATLIGATLVTIMGIAAAGSIAGGAVGR